MKNPHLRSFCLLGNAKNRVHLNSQPYKARSNFIISQSEKLVKGYFLKNKLLASNYSLKLSNHRVEVSFFLTPVKWVKLNSIQNKIRLINMTLFKGFHHSVAISIKIISTPLYCSQALSLFFNFYLKFESTNGLYQKSNYLLKLSKGKKHKYRSLGRMSSIISVSNLTFTMKKENHNFSTECIRPLNKPHYLSNRSPVNMSFYGSLFPLFRLGYCSSFLKIDSFFNNFDKTVREFKKFNEENPAVQVMVLGKEPTKQKRKSKYYFVRGKLKPQHFSKRFESSYFSQLNQNGIRNLKVNIFFDS